MHTENWGSIEEAHKSNGPVQSVCELAAPKGGTFRVDTPYNLVVQVVNAPVENVAGDATWPSAPRCSIRLLDVLMRRAT